MDPITAIGFAANIVQIIDAVVKVVGYLNDVKDAPKDRARLARESTSLLAFLTDFRYKVEESSTDDPWFSSIRLLAAPGGPLEQFRDEMDELARKLKPQSGLRKFGKALVWTLDKNDINNIISRIERLKALVSISRQEDHFKLSLEIKSDLNDLRHGVLRDHGDLDELKQGVLRGQKGQERQNIITWISDLDFSAKQRDFFTGCEQGTGEWFLKSDIFEAWIGGDSGTLWCPGVPGAGKTIIMSLVVDYLERNLALDHVGIAYIYFNYKEQSEQTATNLIASLLQQLVRKDAFVSEEITSLFHRHMQQLTRPTIAEWSMLLESQIGRFSRVFILIDALDECSESTRDEFLYEMQQLQPFINLLITSRPISTIELELDGAARLGIHAADADIRRYLERRVKRERRLRRLLITDSALEETIVETIAENAKGMFLLAQLQMDSVAKKNSRRDIRKALASLPTELNNTYDDAMRRIWSQSEEDVRLAEMVLSWISHALRPLALLEIQHALAVEPGDVSFDDGGIPEEDFLVSVCAGLVTVDQESQIIRLVHHTTQEYFENVRMTRFPYAQASITTTCLTYLSFRDFSIVCDSDEEIDHRLSQYPLLEYAAEHWGDHARGDAEEAVKELAIDFLRKEPNLFAAVQVMHYCTGPIQTCQDTPTNVTGIHIAASFGFSTLIQYLLQLGKTNTNLKDSLGRTPLSLAAGNGHASVVLQLVERNEIDTNVRDLEDQTPLSHAAANGHDMVVKYLLQRSNIDVNAMDKYYGQTPLWRAVDKGYEAVVQLLLRRADVHPNCRDKAYGHTPLWQAVDRGHEEVVRLLLQRKDVDTNAQDKYYGRTPLWQAADRGHAAIVRLLLQRDDVDIESTDRYNGQTPLWRAIERGHDAVVELLVSVGAAAMSGMP